MTAVTVSEALRGRLAAIIRHPTGPLHIQAFSNLVAGVRLLQQFPITDYDQAADDQFQRLRSLRIRIGTRDLKIAATGLANNLTVVTRNRSDFGRVPGLLLEDWSV